MHFKTKYLCDFMMEKNSLIPCVQLENSSKRVGLFFPFHIFNAVQSSLFSHVLFSNLFVIYRSNVSLSPLLVFQYTSLSIFFPLKGALSFRLDVIRLDPYYYAH